jgi:hypothetical protein
MTGPARELLMEPTLRTGQPTPKGRPVCWRPRECDDNAACALAYTPRMQADLLQKSPGCEGCFAGINAAALYYQFRKVVS